MQFVQECFYKVSCYIRMDKTSKTLSVNFTINARIIVMFHTINQLYLPEFPETPTIFNPKTTIK